MQQTWRVTKQAARDYLSINNLSDDERLMSFAIDAIVESAQGARFIKRQRNGLERWRTRAPGRLYLVVKNHEHRLDVIRVMPEYRCERERHATTR